MRNILVIVSVLFLSFSSLMSWDRYTNETEHVIGNYSFQKIIHYSFSISTAQTVTLETKDSNGDTYMYLWSDTENRQITKNDDGGAGYHSKITSYLQAGTYKVFVRSYSSNASSTCDLYKNGYQVYSDVEFAGTKVYVGSYDAETRFRTTDLVGDTYVLLLNSSGNLIGYDDDGGGGLASSVIAAEKPSYFIVGAYSSSNEGTANVRYTKDDHLEFRAYCGGPQSRFPQSGNEFISEFETGDYNHENVIATERWNFLNNRLDDEWGSDGVDLVWYHGHGGTGTISDDDYDETNWNTSSIDFTSPEGRSGSGHRTNSKSGDLEYISFLSCEVVEIGSESSWGWLDTFGWRSYYNNGNLIKGFFDGLHIVVGYHTLQYDHTGVYNRKSWMYHAEQYANNLDSGDSIWDSWKGAYRKATDKVEHWLWYPDVDLGEISSIHIVPQQDETINDFKSTDYKIGDSNYYFGWRKYHYWY